MNELVVRIVAAPKHAQNPVFLPVKSWISLIAIGANKKFSPTVMDPIQAEN